MNNDGECNLSYSWITSPEIKVFSSRHRERRFRNGREKLEFSYFTDWSSLTLTSYLIVVYNESERVESAVIAVIPLFDRSS